MANLFVSTPYSLEVAEKLQQLGFREKRECISNPDAERYIVVSNYNNTTWIADAENLQHNADLVNFCYQTTINPIPNTEILSWQN